MINAGGRLEMMEEGLYVTPRRSWPRVKVTCACGGVADVWSISGGCDSRSRPANGSPDGTHGGTLLPPCTIMSHVS